MGTYVGNGALQFPGGTETTQSSVKNKTNKYKRPETISSSVNNSTLADKSGNPLLNPSQTKSSNNSANPKNSGGTPSLMVPKSAIEAAPTQQYLQQPSAHHPKAIHPKARHLHKNLTLNENYLPLQINNN